TPHSDATSTARAVAIHIWRRETVPSATRRRGPTRSGGSAPRAPSEASLAKLAATWMARAPTSAATKASQRKTSSPAASPEPTRTGAAAAGSVRGRAAWTQRDRRESVTICRGTGPHIPTAARAALTDGAGAIRPLGSRENRSRSVVQSLLIRGRFRRTSDFRLPTSDFRLEVPWELAEDRKSTRLNSSHVKI